MKIAVLGAGAMGCMFGAKLSKEQDVTIICHRAGQADVINRQSITVFEKQGGAFS